MESIVVTWRELLLVVVLVVGVYAAEVFFLTRSGGRFAKKGDAALQERDVRNLELEIDRLHERLNGLQAELEKLHSGQEVAVRPYGEAVKLAESGMDIEQLVGSCGLSRGEAELIVAVSRMSRQKGVA